MEMMKAISTASIDRFDVDPRRSLIQAERHARPPLPAGAPAICQHLVFETNLQSVADERRACLDICKALDLVPSSELGDQIKAEGENLTLKWERHTEFSSYTFLADGISETADFEPWMERDLGGKRFRDACWCRF